MKKIWVVTYWDKDKEPILTAFDNQEVADYFYKYYRNFHDGCCIDELPIYHSYSFESWEV